MFLFRMLIILVRRLKYSDIIINRYLQGTYGYILERFEEGWSPQPHSFQEEGHGIKICEQE